MNPLRSGTTKTKDLILLLVLVFVACLCEFSIYVLVPLAANEWQGRRAALEGVALLVAPVGATFLTRMLGYQHAFVIVGAINPAMVGLVSEQFSNGERDLGIALWITVLSVTVWLASPALGALSDAAGLAALFPIASFLVILATIALVGYGRWIVQRENAPGELVELWN